MGNQEYFLSLALQNADISSYWSNDRMFELETLQSGRFPEHYEECY
jgi:hypothetical protein